MSMFVSLNHFISFLLFVLLPTASPPPNRTCPNSPPSSAVLPASLAPELHRQVRLLCAAGAALRRHLGGDRRGTCRRAVSSGRLDRTELRLWGEGENRSCSQHRFLRNNDRCVSTCGLVSTNCKLEIRNDPFLLEDQIREDGGVAGKHGKRRSHPMSSHSIPRSMGSCCSQSLPKS